MSTQSKAAVEAEGETIDEAIANALATLGITREAAEVEIIRDAKRSLLGFGGQPACVRVSPRGELGAAVAGSTDLTPITRSPEQDDAAAVLRKLLALMDVPAEIESAPADEPGQISLRISSPAGGLLIGRHGQTLDALEYLINRIVGRHDERAHRILVDAEGYRQRRSRELCEMASRIAARVRQTARAHTMNPLSPRERRIVHMALAGDATCAGSSSLRPATAKVILPRASESANVRGSCTRTIPSLRSRPPAAPAP